MFLWTSDEEIGSETSRRAIESEARRSDAVLVLEPSLGREGRLKTQRKGVGGAEVIVTGRSAHAGIEPEKGVNAVHELALQIARLMKMNDPRRGITVQATVVEGGTTSNVVPAHARALVDIRFARLADARGIERELRSLRPILRGARVEVRMGDLRPPLERTAWSARAFSTCAGIDAGDGAFARRGCDRRRVGWKFYWGAWSADARRAWERWAMERIVCGSMWWCGSWRCGRR